MLTALFDSLERLTILAGSPAPEHVADALWLASQLRLTASDDVLAASPSEEPREANEVHPQRATHASAADHVAMPSAEPQLPLVAESGRGFDEQLLPLRIPGAPALPHSLALSRALRPLRRRVPSKFQFMLDEEATAECAAEEGGWHPIMRPVAERWLELALLIDDGPSMEIWRATTQELRRLLERQGIARDVRSWRLDTTLAGRIRLLGASGRGSVRSPAEVSDASGRRLVIIVSDCVSPAWWGPTMAELVRVWSRHQPVSVVQMLPQRLWGQTSLGTTAVVPVRASGAARPNNTLVRMARPGQRRERGAGASSFARPFVPITTLEPEFVRVWSRFLAARAGGLGPAVGLGNLRSAEPAGRPALSPSQAVERFHARASPLTFQLACLLAAAPLRLPVMRLVQRSMLPTSGQVHLAEFFSSGLLVRGSSGNPDLEEALFDFGVGIRDALLEAGTFTTHLEVQRRVSEFIAPRFGQALDFNAYLANPERLSSSTIDAEATPFAAVSAAVLRRLGGKYSDAAERFLRGRGLGRQPDFGPEAQGGPSSQPPIGDKIDFEVVTLPAGTRWSRITSAKIDDPLSGSRATTPFNDPASSPGTSPRWRPEYFADSFKTSLVDAFPRLGLDGPNGIVEEQAIAGYDWIEFENRRPLRLADLHGSLPDGSATPRSESPQSLQQTQQLADNCFSHPDMLDGITLGSRGGFGDALVLFDVRVLDALLVTRRQPVLSKRAELDAALAARGLALVSSNTVSGQSLRQVALVIAVDAGAYPKAPRLSVTDDIALISRLLADLGFEVYRLINPTQADIRERLSSLGGQQADSAVIYLCGYIGIESAFIFLASESNPGQAQIADVVANSSIGQTLFIVDAVNLPEVDAALRLSTSGSGGGLAASLRSVSKNVSILMSGDSTEVAYGGAFARYLDEILRKKVLASGESASVAEIFDALQTRHSMLSASDRGPYPKLWQHNVQYKFMFHPPRAGPGALPDRPSDPPGEGNARVLTSPDYSRVAQVFFSVPSASGPVFSGTGYMIADRVILTADYVVPDDTCEIVLPFASSGEPAPRRYSGQVVYRSNALDLALVEMSGTVNEGLPRTSIPFGVWRAIDPARIDCMVLGVGRTFSGGQEGSKPIRVFGQLEQSGVSRNSLDIVLERRLLSDDDMRGLSGSMVFSNAVAVAVLQAIGGQIRVSRIAELLHESEFVRYWNSRGLPASSSVSLPDGTISERDLPSPPRGAVEVLLGSLHLLNQAALFAEVARAIEAGTPVIAMSAIEDDLPGIFLEGLPRRREIQEWVESMQYVEFDPANSAEYSANSLIRAVLRQLSPSSSPSIDKNSTPRPEDVRRLLEGSGRRNAFYTVLPAGSWSVASGVIRSFVDFWSVVGSRERGLSRPFFVVVLGIPGELDMSREFREAMDSKRLRVTGQFSKITRNDVIDWMSYLSSLESSPGSDTDLRGLVSGLRDELLRSDRVWTLRELRDEMVQFLRLAR